MLDVFVAVCIAVVVLVVVVFVYNVFAVAVDVKTCAGSWSIAGEEESQTLTLDQTLVVS